MIQSLDGIEPDVHESAYVHPGATIIGDVTLEADTSVWPGTVLRGDEGSIVVREGANVQDNAVCHEGVEIGRSVTVGHSAIVHDCTVGERALVGMNAVVLDGTVVGDGAIVAAGSTVTEDTDVPPRTLFAGTPASLVREDIDEFPGEAAAKRYVERTTRYENGAEVIQGSDSTQS